MIWGGTDAMLGTAGNDAIATWQHTVCTIEGLVAAVAEALLVCSYLKKADIHPCGAGVRINRAALLAGRLQLHSIARIAEATKTCLPAVSVRDSDWVRADLA